MLEVVMDELRSATDVIDDVQWVPVNLWETDRSLVVAAPMPGVMHEDVRVRLAHGTLYLDADLRSSARRDYVRHEWSYGSYHRQVDIGSGYGAPITASLGNGVLAVSVARVDGDRPSVTVSVQPAAAGGGRSAG